MVTDRPLYLAMGMVLSMVLWMESVAGFVTTCPSSNDEVWARGRGVCHAVVAVTH